MKESNDDITNINNPSQKGVELLVNKFYHEYSKLPMLELILQKFAYDLSNELRKTTKEVVEVKVNSFDYVRIQNFFAKLRSKYSIIEFTSNNWGGASLLILNNQGILSFLNLVFGGKKSQKKSKDNSTRSLTTIEQSIARFFGEIILGSLSNGFQNVVETNFLIEKLENNYKYLDISDEYGILISIEVFIENSQSIEFEFLFPYKTLEPIKNRLQRSDIIDNNNSETITASLSSLEILLECRISSSKETLSDIVNLKVKDLILFDAGQNDLFGLYHHNVKVASGRLGKVGDRVALQIED